MSLYIGGWRSKTEVHGMDTTRAATPSSPSFFFAMGAKKKLGEEGVAARVVSMPCTSVFDRQPPMYKDIVLIPTLPKIAVEPGVIAYCRKSVGRDGAVVGTD